MQRVAYLDALRGLAAAQVLLLHLATAYFPDLVNSTDTATLSGRIHLSPLFFLYDGYSAVYIFFALSGFVLTRAFAGYLDRPIGLAVGRVGRLLIPAAAAVTLSLVLKLLLGHPNAEAGQLTGSSWLAMLWQPPQGAAFFLRDAFINSVFLGYDGPSPFPGSWLDSASQAYISPLWTLSIELYGSLIVLGLSLARKQSNRTWWLAVAIVFVVAFRTHYMCFVLGHALALRPPKPGGRILPLVLIVGGALVCAYAERGTIAPLVWACALDLPSMQCTSHPQKVIGAGLLFVGVLWSLDAHRFLSARPLAVLGKLSFPLYLVHWPFVLGLGSLALVSMVSLIGVDGARVVATLVAAGASLFAAACFVRVDSYAVSVGRCVRDWRWAVRPKF